mmetsp:Transcript_24745/g.38527  ORF Transcript_24745/g.38527 Transcript_24745/m.38527 type:complete len:131 (-) Transcript_24745:242-634(-)
MAKNLRSTVLKKIDREPTKMKHFKDEFSIDRIMQKIHFVRVLDEADQQVLHSMLDSIVARIPNLRLVVLDTFSEHFRSTDMGYNDRKKLIADALVGLQKIAYQRGISIILINNMKTGRRDYVAEQQALGN